MMTSAELVAWLRFAAAELTEHRDELTALDAAIGDADHGVNMDRGFRAVLAKVEGDDLLGKAPGEVARAAAMALISTVGGAAGPLYGTFFLRFGAALGSRSEYGLNELAAAFRAGLDGLQQRGKAQPGEKTIVDALAPASAALESALGAGQPLAAALRAAEEAARQGMLATAPLVATKGRASYLGERSRGHQDPGATSAYLIVKAAVAALAGTDLTP
jgi:dihydroxyacetone kinase-like protein